MAYIIRQYYNQFNQIINHTFGDVNRTSFSEADLNNLPKGISLQLVITNIGIMRKSYDKLTISNYYNTQEQYKEIEHQVCLHILILGYEPLEIDLLHKVWSKI